MVQSALLETRSPLMTQLWEKVCALKGKNHLNILILGESGTGKEIVARAIHEQEGMSHRPWVTVNMAALPGTLVESELFGHEKGAFTDGRVARVGKFEAADGGDLFLDEIGDLSYEAQAKILRTIQTKEIQRLGSTQVKKVDFRLVSATNQPLSKLVSEGKFRDDLVYRLAEITLVIPPLRLRKEDVCDLVHFFVSKYSTSGQMPKLHPKLISQLSEYDWPGNVRQLESTVKRMLIFNEQSVIDRCEIFDPASVAPIPFEGSGGQAESFMGQIQGFGRKILTEAIIRCQGNRQAAMCELGLTRATFYRKLKEFNVVI